VISFARSTVIIHLERLMSEELVLREKKPCEGRVRPKFLYRLVDVQASKHSIQPSSVVVDFPSLGKSTNMRKADTANSPKTHAQTKTAG
jgi:predicted ArsR family transcriptional regulator